MPSTDPSGGLSPSAPSLDPAASQAEAAATYRRMMRWVALVFIIVAALLVTAGWATDALTMQGEYTIYTVDCQAGRWLNKRCAGKLVAAERIRFRALKPHHEVVFWSVGGSQPSQKLAPCVIADGRNWSCTVGSDAPPSVTFALESGRPIPDPSRTTKPFHSVSKLTWLLLSCGITLTDTATAYGPQGAFSAPMEAKPDEQNR